MSGGRRGRPATGGAHTCHADGCDVRVSPKMFMCRVHWGQLPKELRDAVWRTYRPGQESDKQPSGAYLRAAREAIAWLSSRA